MSRIHDYPDEPPFPTGMLRLVDRIEALSPHGGRQGLGYIRGDWTIDPEAWFFKAHFLGDPVWPGSLGLEAFLEIMKFLAVNRWGGGPEVILQAPAAGLPHQWAYRGQVVPGNREVILEAEVASVDEDRRIITADGLMSVDGLPIYRLNGFSVQWRTLGERSVR